jgi:uncharacterized membrane protein (DUF485 family)
MDYHKVYQSPGFKKLVRARARVIWPLSFVLVLGLAGNLYLMSSGAHVGARTLTPDGVVTVALAYSLVLIFLGASVAAFYVWWANTYLDPMTDQIRQDILSKEGDRSRDKKRGDKK